MITLYWVSLLSKINHSRSGHQQKCQDCMPVGSVFLTVFDGDYKRLNLTRLHDVTLALPPNQC